MGVRRPQENHFGALQVCDEKSVPIFSDIRMGEAEIFQAEIPHKIQRNMTSLGSWVQNKRGHTSIKDALRPQCHTHELGY